MSCPAPTAFKAASPRSLWIIIGYSPRRNPRGDPRAGWPGPDRVQRPGRRPIPISRASQARGASFRRSASAAPPDLPPRSSGPRPARSRRSSSPHLRRSAAWHPCRTGRKTRAHEQAARSRYRRPLRAGPSVTVGRSSPTPPFSNTSRAVASAASAASAPCKSVVTALASTIFASLISDPRKRAQPVAFLDRQLGVKLQEPAHIGIRRVAPELPELVGAEQIRRSARPRPAPTCPSCAPSLVVSRGEVSP